MTITAQTWAAYIRRLSRLNEKAGRLMADYITAHGTADAEALIAYAAALVTKYGEGSAELACQMYEAIADLQGAAVPPAVPAQPADYSEVARMVNATRNSPPQLQQGVSRLVKRAGADTTLQNALRDGAEFAWVPHGDSCPFCLTLASRGWQRASQAAIKNGHAEHIHANCDCEYAIRFDGRTNVAGYDPDEYLCRYREAGSDVNALRRVEYAKNKDRINAQKRAAYAARKGLTTDKSSGILDIVEQTLGFKKGSEISVRNAVAGANPNYANNSPYSINCQRCVQTYELRRRGYDVVAKPFPTKGNTIVYGSECFIQPGAYEYAYQAYTMRQTGAAVKKAIESAPNGARFSVYVQWKRSYGGNAHVFIAEKIQDTVHYLDPQTGSLNVEHYFDMGANNKFGYFRLDDKPLTTDAAIISATVEVKQND